LIIDILKLESYGSEKMDFDEDMMRKMQNICGKMDFDEDMMRKMQNICGKMKEF
jgi:hypothetical protein